MEVENSQFFLVISFCVSQKKWLFLGESFSSPESVCQWANAARSVTDGWGFDSPWQLLPLLAWFLLYCLCVFPNTRLCETAPLLQPRSTARHTALASLSCARCFGEFLWDAAFDNNFGEKFRGTTVRSNFAALQQHWRTIALKNGRLGDYLESNVATLTALGSSYSELLSITALGSGFG